MGEDSPKKWMISFGSKGHKNDFSVIRPIDWRNRVLSFESIGALAKLYRRLTHFHCGTFFPHPSRFIGMLCVSMDLFYENVMAALIKFDVAC